MFSLKKTVPSTARTLASQARSQSSFAKGNLKNHIVSQYSQNNTSGGVELAGWQKLLGEGVINWFNIDVDKTRAGPVASVLFKDMCKLQGYYSDRPGEDFGKNVTEHQKFYYETLALPRTFQQQFQISSLHIWMLFVRLRALPRKYCREYQRKLVNSVFEDLGFRMRQDIRISSESIINTNKKHLNEQLRGAIFAYDEGFYTSDSTLASALWRDLFNAQKDVNMEHLEQMVHYVRTQLYVFEQMSDRDFAAGKMGFLEPWLRYDPLSKQDVAEIKAAADESRKEVIANPKPSDRSVLSQEGW